MSNSTKYYLESRFIKLLELQTVLKMLIFTFTLEATYIILTLECQVHVKDNLSIS